MSYLIGFVLGMFFTVLLLTFLHWAGDMDTTK